MNTFAPLLVTLSVVAWTAGCGEHGAPAPMTRTTDRASTAPETWIGNVALGSGDEAAEPGDNIFAPGELITLTMQVADMPASSTLQVIWY